MLRQAGKPDAQGEALMGRIDDAHSRWKKAIRDAAQARNAEKAATPGTQRGEATLKRAEADREAIQAHKAYQDALRESRKTK